MGKLKLFIENFLVYGLGGIIGKIIPLVMVPIITRLMPDSSYFGVSDLSNTVINFASALAVMGMYDAMYRMFFEKDDENYKKEVCSTAFAFSIITSGLIFIIMLMLRDRIAQFFFGNVKYVYLVYISAIATLVGSTNSIISAPTRMQNKRKIYLITNIVSPILSYSISIPLLLSGYYVIALPVAGVITSFTMEISFYVLNRCWFDIKRFNVKLLRPLLIIAIPLFPNFLIYWLFNSADKVMIANLMDVEAAGIYSVGSKLGHASQLIYTAFAGGWQYFAFSTMREKDQVRSNSLVFEYLGIISFTSTLFICAFSYSIFTLLFREEYVSGYIVAPYLFMAPLLQMLFQVAANQFLVIKKTWPNMLILLIGAIINVITNYFLIPILGIEGACLATLFGYAISVFLCVIILIKMELMTVSFRFIGSVWVMGGYLVFWRLLFHKNISLGLLIAILVTVGYGIVYRKELYYLICKAKI